MNYKYYFFIISLVAILPLSIYAESERSHQYQACLDSTDGIAMNSEYANCASEEQVRQEEILKNTYNTRMRSLSSEQQSLLSKAQVDWLAYRESWCRLEEQSDDAPGGTANYYYCLLDKTVQQIEVIKELQF